jgi:LysM repeat protein
MNLVASMFQEYVVTKKSMKLSEISKKFKIKKNYVLATLNGVNENATINKGDIIKLPFRVGEFVSPSNNLYADLFEKPRREVLRKSTRMRYRRYAARKKLKSGRYQKRSEVVIEAKASKRSPRRVVASANKKSRKYIVRD